MKKTFPAYYQPSEDDFGTLWRSAIFVLDANVLLNVYGYSEATRSSLFKILEGFNGQLWIPYQFALEYQENRIGKIIQQIETYEEVEKNLRKTLTDVFKPRKKHPFISPQLTIELENTCNELLKGAKEQEVLLREDSIFKKITALYESKVGPQTDEATLQKWYVEGKARYDKKVPPGYEDIAKPEPNRYGDLIAWKQILDYSSTLNKPLILVTEDTKEDWWYLKHKRRISPRIELTREFQQSCSQTFLMYTLGDFLRWGAKHLGQEVSEAAIAEVKEQRDSQSPDELIKPVPASVAVSDESTSGDDLKEAAVEVKKISADPHEEVKGSEKLLKPIFAAASKATDETKEAQE